MSQEKSVSYEEAQIIKTDIRRHHNEIEEGIKLTALMISGIELRTMMKFANEKGANPWLTSRPVKEKGLTFSCSEFRDAVQPGYAFYLENLPTK